MICEQVGWQHDDLIKKLEAKRKTKAAAWYQTKLQLNALKAKANAATDKKLGVGMSYPIIAHSPHTLSSILRLTLLPLISRLTHSSSGESRCETESGSQSSPEKSRWQRREKIGETYVPMTNRFVPPRPTHR